MSVVLVSLRGDVDAEVVYLCAAYTGDCVDIVLRPLSSQHGILAECGRSKPDRAAAFFGRSVVGIDGAVESCVLTKEGVGLLQVNDVQHGFILLAAGEIKCLQSVLDGHSACSFLHAADVPRGDRKLNLLCLFLCLVFGFGDYLVEIWLELELP